MRQAQILITLLKSCQTTNKQQIKQNADKTAIIVIITITIVIIMMMMMMMIIIIIVIIIMMIRKVIIKKWIKKKGTYCSLSCNLF